MELGEGADALRYFDQLNAPPADWQALTQWYRALSQFLAGGTPKAIPAFKDIAAQPKAPF